MLNRLLARSSMALAMVLAAGSALAQDLAPKAAPQAQPIAIVNARIHPVAGPEITGAILFDKGVITQIVEGKLEPAAGTKVIDAKGQHVYPGLIAANTQLGLTEFGLVRATNDINETGDTTPEARAASSVNPDSNLLPVTRTNGVLIAAVFPEGGRISGQVGVMRMDGWTWEQMAITTSAGLAVEWPSMRPFQAPWMERSDEDQQRDIRRALASIDETFKSARAYFDARAADPARLVDTRYEAMRGVFAKDAPTPVFVSAGDVDQITAAVTWSLERGVKLVIVGGRDAHLCADLLKKHDVPVIITGTHSFPKRSDSPYDDAFTLPKRLADAGVRFCIASADRTAHERNLPYNASTAVAYGLDRASAIKSLTLWPAQILGIDAALPAGPGRSAPSAGYGSLEVGKSATLIVTSGDVLEITSNPVMAFIDGRTIDLSNKQSALAQKYREKYRQLKGGPSSAGR